MKLNPRVVWALIYAGVNATAAAIILGQGELLGDLAGFDSPPVASLLSTLTLLCGSIFGLLGLFTLLTKVRFPKAKLTIEGDGVGLFMTTLLVCFILYVAATGLFVAGSSERGGSIVSALWVAIFNVDTLFFVYYATFRNTRSFKLNLFLWALSFMQRGWFAYLFFIFGMESFRLIRERRMFQWRVLAIVIPLVAMYPLLDLVKVYVRVSENISVSETIAIFNNELSASDFSWAESLQLAGEKIVGRVQVVSHAQAVLDNAPYFAQLSDAELSPFWKEGMAGVFIDRFLGKEHGAEAAQALAAFIVPQLESSWNVNPSLVGWFGMHIDVLPLALAYVLALCLLSAWLHQQLSETQDSFDRLWFIWLTLLIPGWIAQFVSIILAQIVFLVVVKILNKSTPSIPRVSPVFELNSN